VRVSAEKEGTAEARPGDKFGVVVRLEIEEGWHINANPAGSATLVPVQVTLAEGVPAKLVGSSYPQGKPFRVAGADEARVYEGAVEIRVEIELAAGVEPGDLELPLRVRLQACDERSCLAPAKVEAGLRLRVLAP
jgi:DsbC/DsbD-like thiol-disulfide interchange protein